MIILRGHGVENIIGRSIKMKLAKSLFYPIFNVTRHTIDTFQITINYCHAMEFQFVSVNFSYKSVLLKCTLNYIIWSSGSLLIIVSCPSLYSIAIDRSVYIIHALVATSANKSIAFYRLIN